MDEYKIVIINLNTKIEENMFDYADISEFPTTEQQIAFANEWYKSLGKG